MRLESLNGKNTALYLSLLTAANDQISARAPTVDQNPYASHPIKQKRENQFRLLDQSL